MKRVYFFCLVFTIAFNIHYTNGQQVIDMMNSSSCRITYRDLNFELLPGMENEVFDWVDYYPYDPSPRHEVHTTAGTDVHCPAIPYLPDGASASIRMGSNVYQLGDNAKGGRVSFSFTVTKANAIALFKYAGLIDKAEHNYMYTHNFTNDFVNAGYTYQKAREAAEELQILAQPWMQIYVTVNNNTVDCASLKHAVYNLDKTQGWQDGTGTVNELVNGVPKPKRTTYYRYKPWTTVGMDLSAYIGKTVTISAEYYDCAISNYQIEQGYNYYYGEYYYNLIPTFCEDHHFARFYCNLTCTAGELTLMEEKCSPQPQVTYKAPDGFVSYRWYSSKNPSNTLGTGKTCTYKYNGSEALDLCCEVKSSTDCAATVLKQHLVYCPANCVTPEMTFVEDTDNGVTYKVTEGFTYRWYSSKNPSTTLGTGQTCTYTYNGDEELDLYCQLSAHSECTPVILKQHLVSATACDSYTACNGTEYTASGNYDIFCPINGASNTPVHLHLTVNKSYTTTDQATICDSELPYKWEDVIFTKDDFTGTNKKEVTRTLTAKNKCDSVVTFTLTVNKAYKLNDKATICDSELPYTWQDVIFTKADFTNTGSKDVTRTLKTVNACDSIVTFTLNVNKTYSLTDKATICDNELPYTWEEEIFTEAGSKTKKLKSIAGCDSTVTFTLTVNKTYEITDGATVCESELPYKKWQGEIFTKEGTKTKTLKSITGCDSIVKFTLNVIPTIHKSVSRTVCDKALPYKWDGLTFGGEGMQTRKLKSLVTGCDSVVDYHLSVSTGYMAIDGATVCTGDLPYTWEGYTFTKAGTKTQIFRSVSTGCDSVVTFTLEVRQSPETTVKDIFCEGGTYTFGDTLITEAGTYIKRFAREGKCDSVVTLVLTALSAPVTVTEEATVTEGESYTWAGHGSRFADLNADSTYRDTLRHTIGDCDSAYYELRLHITGPNLSMTVTADTVCADDPAFTLRLLALEGKPLACDILFDEAAKKQRFRDSLAVALAAGGKENIVAVDMPFNADDTTDYVRPGDYGFTVRVKAAGDKTVEYPCTLSVLYPSWVIFQRWNDILAISNADYNGGYTFSDIRWFHNGQPIENKGDNGAYVYQKLNMGEPYYALLTRADDGKTVRTCTFYPEQQSENTEMQALRVRLLPRRNADSRQAQIEANAEGQYTVYDFAGRTVCIGQFADQTDLLFPASAAEGTYLVFFHATDGRTASCKWIIQGK